METHAKQEILRYLGYRGQALPEGFEAQLEECMREMRAAAAPRHIQRAFPLRVASDGLALAGAALVLPGKDIARHLMGCTQAVLLAATLGAGADSLIRRWEYTDLTRSLLLDTCATQLIEEYCDRVEREVRTQAADGGLCATGRFSPGYGDLPLELQPAITAALDTPRKIGLTCSESLLLLPRKSVTAVIGLGKDARRAPGGCAGCPARDSCRYKREG